MTIWKRSPGEGREDRLSDGCAVRSQIMISNNRGVGMATFPHKLLGSVLKIGSPEVRQRWRRTEAVWPDGSAVPGRLHCCACAQSGCATPSPSRGTAAEIGPEASIVGAGDLTCYKYPCLPPFYRRGKETGAQRG